VVKGFLPQLVVPIQTRLSTSQSLAVRLLVVQLNTVVLANQPKRPGSVCVGSRTLASDKTSVDSSFTKVCLTREMYM